MIRLKQLLETLKEYDNGEDCEVYIQSGDFLTSPLSFITKNAQGTIFLDYDDE